MEQNQIHKLLTMLQAGKISVDHVEKQIKDLPFSDMGFAKVDHHRAIRTGYPEVIFCQNKAPQHVVAIVEKQIAHNETVFGTRATPEVLAAVKRKFRTIEIDELGRCFWKKSKSWKKHTAVKGKIVVASAGTADWPVAAEALRTVEIMGHTCEMICDVGVAGIHRLFAHHAELQNAAVVIVIAGMEGALPSVVAGLVSCPVIGVPTSVGYGSHLNGLVPLFAMLNSCASGLTVVNIDNGFGAGFAAAMMNRMPEVQK